MKTPHCIMIVDRNLTDNWIAERILKIYAIASEIRIAFDREDAIKILKEYYSGHGCLPELIMVEGQLWRNSGIDLIKAIKKHNVYNKGNTKIALLTTVAEFTLNCDKIEQGIDQVFIKPLDIQQLKLLLTEKII